LAPKPVRRRPGELNRLVKAASPALTPVSTLPKRGISSRLDPVVLLVSGVAALACLWMAWCEFPFYHWNELRLAPAFALRHGVNPYPPFGGGPLSTWIYGPVGILINLPATFGDTAVHALQTAFVINTLVVLGPLAIVCFTSPDLRARGCLYPFGALALAVLFVPRPALALQVADHAAIAAGVLSCWQLSREANPSWPRLIIAGVLCALAVWAKQIALFLLLGQLGYLRISGGWKPVVRYVGVVGVVGFIAFAAFAAAFGFQPLWFNLVTVPGRLPWANFAERLQMRAVSVFLQTLLPAILLLSLALKRWWPSRGDATGRFFQLTVWAAAVMLPVGFAGFFKIGGDTNLFHSWNYLLPALTLLLFIRAPVYPRVPLLLIVLLFGLVLRQQDIFRRPASPYVRHHTVAAEIIAANRGKVWFPQNPLISFYADRRLWHVEDGLSTRFLAGFGVREVEFRRDLPPAMEAIVYPSANTRPFALALLPDFNHLDALPYWNVYLLECIHSRPVGSGCGQVEHRCLHWVAALLSSRGPARRHYRHADLQRRSRAARTLFAADAPVRRAPRHRLASRPRQ
jgi:hypothetical protein